LVDLNVTSHNQQERKRSDLNPTSTRNFEDQFNTKVLSQSIMINDMNRYKHSIVKHQKIFLQIRSALLSVAIIGKSDPSLQED